VTTPTRAATAIGWAPPAPAVTPAVTARAPETAQHAVDPGNRSVPATAAASARLFCAGQAAPSPSPRTHETRPSSQPAPTPTSAEEFARVPGAISGALRRRATPPQRPPRPVSRMGAQVRRRSCRSGHRAAFVLAFAFAFAFSRYAAGDRRSAAAAGVTPERPAPRPVGRCSWIGGHRRPPADGTAMSDQHRPGTTDACDDEGAEGMVEQTR